MVSLKGEGGLVELPGFGVKGTKRKINIYVQKKSENLTGKTARKDSKCGREGPWVCLEGGESRNQLAVQGRGGKTTGDKG